MMRVAGWGKVVAIAAIVAAIVALPWLAPIAIYRPVRLDRIDPAAWGVRYSRFGRFAARDGAALAGWWHDPGGRAAPVVLLVHGRSGNISTRAEALVALARAGSASCCSTISGRRERWRGPDEGALIADAEAARSLVHARGVAEGRVIVVGQLLGNAPAVAVAARHRLGGAILMSPFASVPDAAAAQIPPLGWLYWPLNRFDVAQALAKVDAPVVFVASARDGLVPWASAVRTSLSTERPVR